MRASGRSRKGREYALWLNHSGVTAFVLKYRLAPAYHHPSMLLDASRAIRIVRANAAAWKLDPKRVGIMGSSAGGHLASTLMTHYDAGKPDSADPIEQQKLPTRHWRALLRGHYDGRQNASWLAGQFVGQGSFAGNDQAVLERTASDERHAALFPVSHGGGQGGARGKQFAIRDGAESGGRAV